MESTQNNISKKQTKKSKSNTTPIRVLKTTAKTLKGIVQKLNKKPLGKKIRVDDLILKSLSLLEDEHFEEIKNSTLTNADRLEMKYQEYCRVNGPVSKDEFLGKLLTENGAFLAPTSENPSLDQ
jgi:hypothetical protein